MLTELEKLENIIYRYDTLVGEWLDGNRASLYTDDTGRSVYDVSDELRNESLEIIKDIRSKILNDK